MHFVNNGYRFEAAGTDLIITRNGEACMTLPAVPRLDDVVFEAGPWQAQAPDHFQMQLSPSERVHLAVREGCVCYWVETDREHVARLTLFPDSTPTPIGWHTFLSDELDRGWSIDENADVPVSSSYLDMHVDGEDGAGMTDPGDKPPTWVWNVPVRACAFAVPGASWLGAAVPGPVAVGVTRFTMRHGVFNLTFEELRPNTKEWGPPRVYLLPGLTDPYETLDRHRIIAEQCGLTNTEIAPHPEWWGYPPFKIADEIHRLNQGKWMEADADGHAQTALTTSLWLECTQHVQDYARLGHGTNLELDQIFFYGYGGKQVIDTLGGNEGLRKTIDELRRDGVRVGLYIHLFMLDPTATDFPEQHPDAICTSKDPTTVVKHGCAVGSQDMAYVDWTHPAGRDYMMSLVEWLIGDGDGCLNADWLLMNNNLCVDPRRPEFHDPDWGTGDLMAMKATRMAYEKAKSLKPHCLVRRNSIAAPYMQPYCDITNMCEEWNGNTRAWYRRARIATHTLRNVMHQIDGWFVTLTKLTEYYFGLAAFTIPEIYSVRHAIHPYVYYREMRDKDYRRIRAGIQTYLNAPVRKGQRSKLDFHDIERPEIWRRHCDGPLAGWYAAIGLDKRCFVTYSDTEARVAASKEIRVTIPLPPGTKVEAVEGIPHEGEPQPCAWETTANDGEAAIRLWVPDAAGAVMYIRIRYRA